MRTQRSGEVTCMSPKHEDADWWKLMWENKHEIREVQWNLSSHNRETKKNMSLHARYVLWLNDKTDEQAKEV